ncbi:hypothetical protein PAL_GLEAN10006748 [Pteropus alecto]|uniref:Uncharacterized protein n=1 Tax=Pteropus alecto TaxID=9402 RepID=L5L7I7_PTEAL|nr:hypothetical protein PAL_GLEAN10006748 [Pteropus alecto]
MTMDRGLEFAPLDYHLVVWSEVSHSLLIVPSSFFWGSTETALSITDTLRGSGEISYQTCFEKRERIVGVRHRQVQHHAGGERAAAEPLKRESPDERTELTGRVEVPSMQLCVDESDGEVRGSLAGNGDLEFVSFEEWFTPRECLGLPGENASVFWKPSDPGDEWCCPEGKRGPGCEEQPLPADLEGAVPALL